MPDRPQVAQLGGTPSMPAGAPWPTRRDGRPLSFLAALNFDVLAACAAAYEPDADLHGTLLIFVDPDDLDLGMWYGAKEQEVIDRDDTAYIHVPSGAPTKPRHAPDGAQSWPQVRLAAGDAQLTLPAYDTGELADLYGEWPARGAWDVFGRLPFLDVDGHQLLGCVRGEQRDPRGATPQPGERVA